MRGAFEQPNWWLGDRSGGAFAHLMTTSRWLKTGLGVRRHPRVTFWWVEERTWGLEERLQL